MATVYNTEFRDQSTKAKYPLDATAKQTSFSNDVLLDASVYLPSIYTPPVFILSVDGGVTGDRTRFIIADAKRLEVCHADCSCDEGSAPLMDAYGRSTGVLIYDNEQMCLLRGSLGNRKLSFVLSDTQLEPECCRFYDVKACHTIEAARTALTNRVNIDFVGGVTRADDGSINLYGEEATLGRRLMSINRVKCQHAFILSHAFPNYDDESAIRLETTGSVIKIGKSRDF